MAGEIMPESNVKSGFLGRFFLREKKQPFIKTSPDIYEGLLEAQCELEDARRNLESTSDKNLVDMFIYQMKAAEMKYTHLLQMAKREENGESL